MSRVWGEDMNLSTKDVRIAEIGLDNFGVRKQ